MNFYLPHGEIVPGARDKKSSVGEASEKVALESAHSRTESWKHTVFGSTHSWVAPGRQAQARMYQFSDEAEGNIWGHVQGRRYWRYAGCSEGTGEKEHSRERALSS